VYLGDWPLGQVFLSGIRNNVAAGTTVSLGFETVLITRSASENIASKVRKRKADMAKMESMCVELMSFISLLLSGSAFGARIEWIKERGVALNLLFVGLWCSNLLLGVFMKMLSGGLLGLYMVL
jgi:hypothetical protein